MKKHGFLWWLFIGWWWKVYVILFRVIKALIKRLKAPAETEESGPKKETHKVAGVSYRQEAIQSLGVKNPDFEKSGRELLETGKANKWIYEYKFNPQTVKLVPEPDNPHSENGDAVKVVVDGVHIGYIGTESSAHVHDLIKADRIQAVACTVNGGRKKRYRQDAEEKEEYNLERDDFLFWARVTITTK